MLNTPVRAAGGALPASLNRRALVSGFAAAPALALNANASDAAPPPRERVNALIVELGMLIGELEPITGGKWQINIWGEGAEVTHRQVYRIFDVP